MTSLPFASFISELRQRGDMTLAEIGDEIGLSPSAVSDIEDRKSTRLNSSHSSISYAVFCLKKKKKQLNTARSSPLLCLFNTLRSPLSTCMLLQRPRNAIRLFLPEYPDLYLKCVEQCRSRLD